MAKKLNQVKHDYINHIGEYMYNNHSSFMTLEETKNHWREKRAYDPAIEQELIKQSLLFVSLLENDLDLKFRQRLLNYIANYLSVYTSKSTEFNGDKNRAYSKLSWLFLSWLNSWDAAKKLRKAAKNQKRRPKAKKTVAKKSTKPAVHLFQEDTKIVQKITIDGATHTFEYESFYEYRKMRNQNIAAINKRQH